MVDQHYARDAHRISSEYTPGAVKQRLYVLNADGSFHCVAYQTLTRTELKLMVDNCDIEREKEEQDSIPGL